MKKIIQFVLISLFIFSCGGTSQKVKSPEDEYSSSTATPVVQQEVKKVSGVGIDGRPRSCAPLSGSMICTMMYGPGDQFAADCKKNGNRPVQCGCHDFICIKKK